MNNNFSTLPQCTFLFWRHLKHTNHTLQYTSFRTIIAITPFEQVLAVPDLKFLVGLHRQRGREVIKEQLWRFGCGLRQAVKLAVPII